MEEEFLTVENAIEPILTTNPFTRADDMLLYWLDDEKEEEE